MTNQGGVSLVRSAKLNTRGVSLVESILVVVMLGIIILLMANLPNAMGLINKSKHLSLAREIASKQIEEKRETPYANLVSDPDNPSAILDSRFSLLPNGSGSVKIEDCSSQICTNLEPVKQITVTVSWKEMSKDQIVTLKTFIAEGGLNQ